jgi:hypothetical protein
MYISNAMRIVAILTLLAVAVSVAVSSPSGEGSGVESTMSDNVSQSSAASGGFTARSLLVCPTIPAGYELEERFVQSADPFVARYLALTPLLRPHNIEKFTILGGDFHFEATVGAHPGISVKKIGLVPIAICRLGDALCVDVVTGMVYYVALSWSDEDEAILHGGYDIDVHKKWETGPLTVEEIRKRDGFAFPSLLEFLAFFDRARLDVYNAVRPRDPDDDRFHRSMEKWLAGGEH